MFYNESYSPIIASLIFSRRKNTIYDIKTQLIKKGVNTMEQEISVRDTKSTILKAYKEVLKKLREEKKEDRKTELKKSEEKQIVERASKVSPEKIVNDIASLKIELNKTLDEIEDKRVQEFEKLRELQKAIEIEKKTLNDVYDITVNADSLAALIRAQGEQKKSFQTEQEEKRTIFDEEMSRKKEALDKEIETLEEKITERSMRVEKERKQEEEEYKYKLNKQRTLEKDEYETQKALLEKELTEKREAFEKEFSEREKTIIEKEKEYKELKSRVEAFPAELEKTVSEATQRLTEKLEMQYKYEKDVLSREVDGERKLHQQMIESLEQKLQEKDAIIEKLTSRADDAGKQIQNIAVKAIDGASKLRVIREDGGKNKDNGKD